MHQVTPAIVLRGGNRRAHVTLSVLTGVMGLWALGSVVALLVELLGGAQGTFDLRGSGIPLWLALAASTLVAAFATRDTYADARMTGPRHGLIDFVVEPGGIRLRRQRKWGRPLEVLVQRGETVQLGATLTYQRRGGLERHYRFTVTAPGGRFAFDQAVHIEKLTLAPLDDVARDMGIRITTSGDAVEIERLESVG